MGVDFKFGYSSYRIVDYRNLGSVSLKITSSQDISRANQEIFSQSRKRAKIKLQEITKFPFLAFVVRFNQPKPNKEAYLVKNPKFLKNSKTQVSNKIVMIYNTRLEHDNFSHLVQHIIFTIAGISHVHYVNCVPCLLQLLRSQTDNRKFVVTGPCRTQISPVSRRGSARGIARSPCPPLSRNRF